MLRLQPQNPRRRQALTRAATSLVSRGATVPHISGLTGHDIAFPGHRAQRDPNPSNASQALQEQYDLERALSAAPIVTGKEVTLLAGGAQTFPAMFEALRAAQDSINPGYFILADAQSGGLRLAEILLDRLNAGARLADFHPIDPLESGAHIYEAHDAVVHAKLAVVDDTWTVVGSSNLGRGSVLFNPEVDAVVLGHDTAAQIEALLRHYLDDARPVRLDRWRQRSTGERFREMEALIGITGREPD